MSRPTVAERWARLDLLDQPDPENVDDAPEPDTLEQQWQRHWPDPELKQPIRW